MPDKDNRTEKATPKKRQDARSEGQVCKSQDLTGAFVLIVMFGAIKILGGYIVKGLKEILVKCISVFSVERTVVKADLFALSIELGIKIFLIIMPLVMVALVIGVAMNYAQIGVVHMKEPFKIRWNKLNPINGLKNMFSKNAIAQLVKSLLKITILGYVLYKELLKVIPQFPFFVTSTVPQSLEYMVSIMFSIAFKLSIVYIFIGVADYGYQRWSYEKSIMMTKQEVKDEYKQIEGDPKIKSKIRQKQMQMGMLRMMAAMADADVVITNPTHYAVALMYDEKKASAPTVVAKGKDFIALKIKEKAKEEKIKTVENKPLAQALYATVEIGEEIPPEFYSAVAEILAEIYRLKRKKRI